MALQWMRDRFRHLKWLLWVVIAAFVVLFGGDFTSMGGIDPSRTAAWVGEEEIPTEDVRSRYRVLESYWRETFGERFTPELAEQMNLAGNALQDVVRQRIMLREAKELGLSVTDGEVRDEILAIPGLTDENGSFVGAEEYDRRIRASLRTTPEAFEERLRDDLLTRKLETILGETVYVSDSEVEKRYREQAEKAKIRYLVVPSTNFSDIELTDDALQAYLDANLESFQLPEQRVVDYLLIDAIKLRQELEIPEAEQRAYYDEHIDEYTTEEQSLARHILLQIKPDRDAEAAKEELAAIRTRIEGGEDFAAIAREVSEEPDSAGRGGSLGWFGREAWGADFTEVVFGGVKGSLVGPVQTQYGVHLVEIQDYRPGGARPFEQVSAQIRNRLVGTQANEMAETKASDIIERLGTEGMTAEAFQEFATGEELEVTTTEPFGERDVVPGIGRGEFVESTFGLKRDGISEPIKLPRGWAIVRLRDIIAPRSPVLEDVVDRVRPAALAERQREAAQEQLAEARTRLDEGTVTFDALAEELGIEVQESTEFASGGNVPGLGNQPAMVAEALAGEVGTVGGPFTVAQGAVVFEVSERIHFDPETYAEEKDSFLSTERTARLNQLRAALITRRMRDLEVKYNPDVLELLGVDPSRLQS